MNLSNEEPQKPLQEFKVNDFITLKLEGNNTVIYVDGKEFKHCKYLLLKIPIDEIESFESIESIDEAAEKLDKSMERRNEKVDIPPAVEFWGHCSNLQVWSENNYDTRLLHSNLSFPLLKKLTKAGDIKAKKVFRDEIAERFSSGHSTVMKYLAVRGYLSYLNDEELKTLFETYKENPEKLLEAAPQYATTIINSFTTKNPFQYIKEVVESIPTERSAKLLSQIGESIANVKLKPVNFETQVQVQKSKDSNIELAIKIFELATNNPNCPDKVYELLPHLYGTKNRWDKAITVYEKAIEHNGIKSLYITGIFLAAFYTGRQDIIDKYLEQSVKNPEVLDDPYSISNVIYALNRKETKEASETALKLTKNYWTNVKYPKTSSKTLVNIGIPRIIAHNVEKKTMIPSLWVNMTDTFMVADVIDETLEEIVNEILNKLDEMHPAIYENIAWYFLKKEKIDETIHYLKEAKRKSHPGFKAIRESKYFKSLKDNLDFLKIFN
jgi:tetratricopeptide (TPR) repeat protein